MSVNMYNDIIFIITIQLIFILVDLFWNAILSFFLFTLMVPLMSLNCFSLKDITLGNIFFFSNCKYS